MKKKTFRPGLDLLETRVVLSAAPNFSHGAAIVTKHDLGQTYSMVQKAFTNYTHHSQSVNRLEADLASAVSRIPFNKRDGPLATVESEASQMVNDIRTQVSSPVKSALKRALNDANEFVQGEVGVGVIVLR